MSTGIDYADLVKRVSGDDDAMGYFRELWAQYAPRAFDERKRRPGKLRVSDAGDCALQKWYDIRGELDIPDDYESVDSRLEAGILDGMKTSCKIAAALLAWFWPLTARIEVPIDDEDVPGHADVVVYAEPDAIEVVECKLTFTTKAIMDPTEPDKKGDTHEYWCLQAAKYALAIGAPSFVVLVHAPCTWHGPRRRQFRYETELWRERVITEYARLDRATWETKPKADPTESWRCEYCRVSTIHCERNVNPRGLVGQPTILDDGTVIVT